MREKSSRSNNGHDAKARYRRVWDTRKSSSCTISILEARRNRRGRREISFDYLQELTCVEVGATLVLIHSIDVAHLDRVLFCLPLRFNVSMMLSSLLQESSLNINKLLSRDHTMRFLE